MRRLVVILRRADVERGNNELAVFLLGAFLLFAGAVVAVMWHAGFVAVYHRLGMLEPIWLVLAFAAQALAYLGYTLAYREVAAVEEGPGLGFKHAAAWVSTGFGPFVAQGGFAVDLHAFRQAGVSDREARVRVYGLGALEYALLAPAAAIAAYVLLLDGDHRPDWAVTLPWAIAVPIGFAAAIWVVEHRQRFTGRLRELLDSVYVLRCLLTRPGHLAAVYGTALYWFGDILCLWACLEAFNASATTLAQLIVGYATGYALTRRTLPFAGAGAVEALLPLALVWAGYPLPAALWGVVLYRAFNLWLPLLPAALGLRFLRPDLKRGLAVATSDVSDVSDRRP